MFDVAVIGLGAMGSAAASALARRGKRVVGFERFEPEHNRGSSHGESRAFRLAHFEGEHYSALAREAQSLWRELEATTGEEVLLETGVLECGSKDSGIVKESIEAAEKNGVAHEVLDSRAIAKRFPAFQLPDGWHGVFQKEGGLLRPERAVLAFHRVAKDAGADLRFKTRVESIDLGAGAVTVLTKGKAVEARAVVVTTGPWIGELVPVLKPHLTLTRQVQLWLKPKESHLFAPEKFPTFAIQDGEDICYGFPDFAGTGVKVASHLLGDELDKADDARQDGDESDGERVVEVLSRHIPALKGPVVRTETCIYTNTEGARFVIDRHPDDERMVFASACSGHGFKYASVIGEILADMALGSEPSHDISKFRLASLWRSGSR